MKVDKYTIGNQNCFKMMMILIMVPILLLSMTILLMMILLMTMISKMLMMTFDDEIFAADDDEFDNKMLFKVSNTLFHKKSSFIYQILYITLFSYLNS